MNIKIKTALPLSNEIKELSDELHKDLESIYGKGLIENFHDENKQMLVFYIAYHENGEAVACGALKHINITTSEIKRMYVKESFRGKGISKEILSRLEHHARELHYQKIILETGLKQPEAISLYKKSGYLPIECYGRHIEDPDSRCFEKIIL